MMRKRFNKTLLYIIAGAVCLCLILFLTQIYKNRGGVNVKCNVDYPVSEGITGYRQDDPRWKDYNLGESKYTMGSSGCVTTCIATAVSKSSGAMNPGELVRLMSSYGVFDSAGNMQWGKLEEIPGFFTEVYKEPDPAYIDECLSKGRYPIVKVHRKSLFSYHHFVLIVGAENGDYICMDPLKDGYTGLKDYGNRIYSVRCVWFDD